MLKVLFARQGGPREEVIAFENDLLMIEPPAGMGMAPPPPPFMGGQVRASTDECSLSDGL